MTSTRIIIVGGGFAGVKCARTLRRRLRSDVCDIVLFNRENHLVFHPLLPEVAGGSINADAVAVPLRQLLPAVRCRTETVTGIDLVSRTLRYESHDGEARAMGYDHVVIACGATVDLGRIPGMIDHAFPLKTMGDAVALRSHLMQLLEKAEVCEDPDRRRRYLTVVVVGGGHSGVETTGEINDLLRGSRRFFPAIDGDDISVTLVHRGRALLPEASPRLRHVARRQMQAAGIEVSLGRSVEVVTAEGVRLDDGRVVRCDTVVCTVGSSPSAIVDGLDVARDRGRIKTDSDMRVSGHEGAWAVGDCAFNINTFDRRPCPPTGQSAERQGHQVADNIVRVLSGRPTQPLWVRPLGQFCSLGGRNAVADLLGVRISGFCAWFLWRSVYLFKLPSWSKRVKVGFDWAWDLVFSRDLGHLRTDQTERISRARYQPGDYVFRTGDPAVNFYAIQSGEVEVIETRESGEERPLAVLGAGDFFGEMAMLEGRPHHASVRARTDLVVLVLGCSVFERISESLTPLRDLVTAAVRRRGGHLWRHLPEARAVLERQPVASAFEPAGDVTLRPEVPFETAIQLFHTHGLAHCCVVDTADTLVGIVTRSDFVRALDIVAATDRRHTPTVSEFMTTAPVAVALSDSCLVAAEMMRNRGLKGLPVVHGQTDRRVVGYLRAETFLAQVVGVRRPAVEEDEAA